MSAIRWLSQNTHHIHFEDLYLIQYRCSSTYAYTSTYAYANTHTYKYAYIRKLIHTKISWTHTKLSSVYTFLCIAAYMVSMGSYANMWTCFLCSHSKILCIHEKVHPTSYQSIAAYTHVYSFYNDTHIHINAWCPNKKAHTHKKGVIIKADVLAGTHVYIYARVYIHNDAHIHKDAHTLTSRHCIWAGVAAYCPASHCKYTPYMYICMNVCMHERVHVYSWILSQRFGTRFRR
jgi:serine acetyltransferase